MSLSILPRLLLAGLPLLGLLQAGHAEPVHPRAQARDQERRIRAGESHGICFDLAAGEFLGIVVEQKGIDVKVELFDPEGNKVQEMDSADGWLWEEEIAWVAERSGTHRLVVHPFDRYAAPGAYRIRLDGPRPARSEDRIRLDVLQHMLAATRAFDAGRPDVRLEQLEKALPLWRQLGEERRQAEVLCQMGDALYQLGRAEPAMAHFHRSAALWQKIGAPDRKHWTFLAAWESEVALLRAEEARQHLEEALEFARREGLRHLDLRSRYNLGRLHLQQPRIAAGYFEPALEIARELGDRRQQLHALHELAGTYYDLGENRDALRLFEEALVLAREIEEPRREANALNSLCLVYSVFGHLEKAIDLCTQAIDISHERGYAGIESPALNNLALVYEQNDPAKAEELYQRSLDLGRQSGNIEVQVKALNNLAFLDLLRGKPAQALERSRQALAQTASHREWEIPIRHAMGIAHHRLGNLEPSRLELNTALDLSREFQDRVRESLVIPDLARTERSAGDLRQALALLESGVQLVESLRTKVPDEQLRARFLASRQDTYALYTDTLMSLHAAEPGRGYDAEALRASERARARSLLDILVEAGADIREGAAPELIEREQRLIADLAALEKRRLELITAGDVQGAAKAAERLSATLESYNKVENELRASSPRYAALTQPTPLSVAEIQREVLDRKTLLLEYSLGEERSFLWAVTPDSLQSFELPSRARIEEAARRYHGALTVSPDKEGGKAAGVAAREAAEQLSEMLLRPVERLLAGQTVLVVSDGALQYVPFAALPIPSSPGRAGQGPLMTLHEVVNLPSASVLAVLRRELEGRAAAPKMLAVLADPVFQREDQRVTQAIAQQKKSQEKKRRPAAAGRPRRGLPGEMRAGDVDPRKLPRLWFSGQEADAIAALVPEGQRLKAKGFGASRLFATGGELVHYRIVHFATHGLIDSHRPELSSLVLSLVDEKGEPQNGFLRLHDVYNLKLNADLVVLSACQTALGQEIRGEGLMGLTRGFMYAGAARVLASLWSVDDQATSELMQRFYRHMISSKRTPAAALRQAQIEMSRDPRWASPYYWAGFSLQGEWH